MAAERTILKPTFVATSLAIGVLVVTSPGAGAGDQRSQRSMLGVPASATATKTTNRSTETRPYVPPRSPDVRPGDQVEFVYDGRPNSYTFGKVMIINQAGWHDRPPKLGTTRDHRGKVASKPPSTPPGVPPPAAPPPGLSAPPAAPPGTVATPPAGGGKVVRDHKNEPVWRTATTKVKDHREGYGGDTYVQRSFTDYMGNVSTVTPRQKPPCFGDACWFFGR